MNWKRYILPSALILAFGLTVGIAQNINKALQLSQDATGAFGVDANNNVYFPAHILSNAPRTPTIFGTGATIVGTDTSGIITESSSTSGIQVTFNQAFATNPACVVSYSATATATALVATAGGFYTTHSAVQGLVTTYWCSGRT